MTRTTPTTKDPEAELRAAMARIVRAMPGDLFVCSLPLSLHGVLDDLAQLSEWESVAATGSTLGAWASESDGTRERATTDAEIARAAALCGLDVPTADEGEVDLSGVFGLALMVTDDNDDVRGAEAASRARMVEAIRRRSVERHEPRRLRVVREAIEGDTEVSADADARRTMELSGLARRVIARDWTRARKIEGRMLSLARRRETLLPWAILRELQVCARPTDDPAHVAGLIADRFAPPVVRRAWARMDAVAATGARGRRKGAATVPRAKLSRGALGAALVRWAVRAWEETAPVRPAAEGDERATG